MPLPITRQRRLFCLFVCHDTLTCYGVGTLSLPIPHGMHLVIPTHLYFFWMLCHLSRTFLPKEPKQEPQKSLSKNPKIGFPLSPLPDHAISYLWPMAHYFLYWLSTGWWYLGLACAPLLCMSKTCPLSMRWPWFGSSSAHSVTHPWFLIVWAIFWFPILYGLLPLGAELCLIVDFFSFILLFYSFLQFCYHFLPYHSVISAVMLFDPSLLGLFRPAAYSSLNDLVWSLGFLLHYLRAPVSHLFPLGHP